MKRQKPEGQLSKEDAPFIVYTCLHGSDGKGKMCDMPLLIDKQGQRRGLSQQHVAHQVYRAFTTKIETIVK